MVIVGVALMAAAGYTLVQGWTNLKIVIVSIVLGVGLVHWQRRFIFGGAIVLMGSRLILGSLLQPKHFLALAASAAFCFIVAWLLLKKLIMQDLR
jgi:hypothetical protein